MLRLRWIIYTCIIELCHTSFILDDKYTTYHTDFKMEAKGVTPIPAPTKTPAS